MTTTGKLGSISYAVDGAGPPLFLVGAPAGKNGFAALADALADRFLVVRHDPRGIGESPVAEGTPVDPPALADDLAELIRHIDAGPATIFGASGGAVTAIALFDRDPGLIAHALLHEPPAFSLLPDADRVIERADAAFAIARTDPQEGMQQFSDLVGILQSTYDEGTQPARIVLPPLSEAELEKQRFALGIMAPATIHYSVPDLTAHRDRMTIAAGEASVGQPARRAAAAIGALLNIPLLDAPGNHLAPTTEAGRFANWLSQVLLREPVTE